MQMCEGLSVRVSNPVMQLVIMSHSKADFFQSSVWLMDNFAPHLSQHEGRYGGSML